MTEPYARDMNGYGRNARPAMAGWRAHRVQFVVNYEEGGENNILHGDAARRPSCRNRRRRAWPGQRHWNMESIYEYGARAGFWRLWRMFTGARFRVTVYGVATALQRSPEQSAAMKEAGWEIASHGLKWIEYKDMPEEEERRNLPKRSACIPRSRASALRLVSGPLLDEHERNWSWRRAASLFVRQLCRRPALLGEGPTAAAPLIPYTLDSQRHALRHAAGLQHRRAVLHLPEGHFDCSTGRPRGRGPRC